jgi:hypothetical protein
MPINKSLFNALVKKYGRQRAMSIYMGMEGDNKPSFKKGMKTATKEGHILKHFPKKRKKKG